MATDSVTQFVPSLSTLLGTGLDAHVKVYPTMLLEAVPPISEGVASKVWPDTEFSPSLGNSQSRVSLQ